MESARAQLQALIERVDVAARALVQEEGLTGLDLAGGALRGLGTGRSVALEVPAPPQLARLALGRPGLREALSDRIPASELLLRVDGEPFAYPRTAAVLVIGNEILGAKVVDENTAWLARRLRELGIQLRRVIFLPDEMDVLPREIAALSRAHDHVISTGGVGPTHDDITLAAMARAFDQELVEDPQLRSIIEQRMGAGTNGAALRMAQIPAGAELLWDGMRFPQIRVRNVLVLPGVPEIMRRKFDAVAWRLSGPPTHHAEWDGVARETQIAATLELAVERFPGVEIGSYPRWEEGVEHVRVTVQGLDAAEVEECRTFLADGLLRVIG